MVRRRRRSVAGVQPLDRWAIALILGLSLVLGILVISGDHAAARVRSFSWQDRQVGAEDRAFLLTFSRPMDPTSVEKSLKVTPPLPGKFSWAGRRMAYTLEVPAPYGESFQVTLAQASDLFSARKNQPGRFETFQGNFQTRYRAFAYIGDSGEDAGRLVLANLTQQEQMVLTPPDLVVLDFKPYPLGDRILFAATDAQTYQQGQIDQQLYTVTTGLNTLPPEDLTAANRPGLGQFFRRQPEPQTAGTVELILDSQGYQNLKFDLSPDGQTIVVQRVSQKNPADFGPWVVPAEGEPYPLQTEPGGDFRIAPDSQSLLLLQGQGTAIIPLDREPQEGVEPLDFLPEYGQVFDLTRDGTAAAMVNFNQNDPEQRYLESLFLVTNQGEEKELLQVSGSVLDAQFDPTKRILYILSSELVPGAAEYIEQPMLSAILLETGEKTDLLLLPAQQNLHMSLAPDGLALLLDFAVPGSESDPAAANPPTAHQIWLLPLFAQASDRLTGTPTQNQPEPIPFNGVQATWLP